MATPRKLLFLLALGGVPSAEGFMPKVKKSKTLRPDHLSYIAGGHEASVVLPISQASHKRQGKWQPFTVNKPKQSSSEKLRKAPSEEGRSVNNRHSSSDWLYNLKTLPNSSVLREVKGPVLTLTAWATIVSVVHRLLLWKGKTQLAANMALPLVAHSLLVSSLGLLLVFRTNSSYQRFLVRFVIREHFSFCWSHKYANVDCNAAFVGGTQDMGAHSHYLPESIPASYAIS